jgi:UPF0271 protein
MSERRRIDLNADAGESPVPNAVDEELMRYVTSVSIACGGHAGDAQTMEATLELAKKYGVAAGAHPSYPDRENFGRLAMDISAAELRASLTEQIESLRSVARRIGVQITHVKPHGALYHAANQSPEIAELIADVVTKVDPALVTVAQSGSPALEIYRHMRLRVAGEAFADRRYESDGTLRNRKLEGALLNAEEAALQGHRIAVDEYAFGGSVRLSLPADTLCIHSDTPSAGSIAKKLRMELERAGVDVISFASESLNVSDGIKPNR